MRFGIVSVSIRGAAFPSSRAMIGGRACIGWLSGFDESGLRIAGISPDSRRRPRRSLGMRLRGAVSPAASNSARNTVRFDRSFR